MSEPVSWLLATLGGVLLGVFFYGGLWLTIKKGLTSKWAAGWFLLSLWGRVLLTLLGLYVIAGGDGKRLLACSFGFIVSRPLIEKARNRRDHHASKPG